LFSRIAVPRRGNGDQARPLPHRPAWCSDRPWRLSWLCARRNVSEQRRKLSAWIRRASACFGSGLVRRPRCAGNSAHAAAGFLCGFFGRSGPGRMDQVAPAG
jgi:hypothetical protein